MVMKNGKRLLSLLLCALLLCAASPLYAAADDQSTLVIGTSEGLRGDTVTVDISLTSVNGIASGGFTISYNSSILSVVGAEEGAALSCCTAFINTEYSQNAVRVSFMGTTALPSAGTLVSLQFQIKENAAPGSYPLTASNVKFSDTQADVVSKSAENGSIVVHGVCVSLSSAELVAGQGIDLDLCVQPPLAPCGGVVSLQYDPTFLSCGTVTPVKAIGDTPISMQYSVNADEGIINISWMASKPISDFGKLCSVHIETNKQSVGIKTIRFKSCLFVDQNGGALPIETLTAASLNIRKRPDTLPKLYFSGSSSDEAAGIVTISAYFDGADLACAGSTKIQYDASAAALVDISVKCSGLVLMPEQPESANGNILLSWASADPIGDDVCLVEMKFHLAKTAKSGLMFTDTQLFDKEGLTIDLFDLENTEIFGQKQWVKITEVSASEEKSVLNIRLDESIPSSAKMLLAAYDVNGRFVGVHICTAEETIAAKTANGAEVSFVQAKSKKLFLLATDGSPLFGSIEF